MKQKFPKVSDFTDKEFVNKYQKSPISHPYVVFPRLIEVLGSIKGKKILDLGCGTGDLSRILAKNGAIVDAVDLSQECVERCKQNNTDMKNITTSRADASELKNIKSSTFDFVVMNMVFLNVNSKVKLEKSFKEVARVLKKEGIFVFTDLHPLALMIPKTLTEEQQYLEGFSYFKDATLYTSKVLLADGTTSITFTDIHWTLETYTTFINNNGLYIYRIIEPYPINGAPKLFNNYKLPEHIMFVCKKL